VASKREQRLLERKAAKQKKLLLFLVPVFLGLLAWQGPGILRAFTGGGDASPAPATSTSATPPAPPAAPPASPAPPAAAPGAAPPAVAAEEAGLPETDVPVQAEEGQLVSFSRFVGKDPFKQQLSGTSSGAGAASTVTPPAPGTTPPPPAAATPPPPPPAATSGSSPSTAARATSARIEVNGSVETVAVRATFPVGDPVFRLASISGGAVRIGLVTGAFEGGAKTVEVRVGESVVLVSKPDGLRYRIRVLNVA
jgi:hypothetical protein